MRTNTDLLAVAQLIVDSHISVPDYGYPNPDDRTTPHLALEGTDREYVASHGIIAGHQGSLVLRVDSDGGVSMSMTLLVGLGGYSTTMLPRHSDNESILEHADRAVQYLKVRSEKVKADRRAFHAEMESANS